MLHVEPGEVVSGPSCPCCARPGRSAFGFVHRGSESIAFYYAWLDPHADRRVVSLAISLGDWAPSGDPAERQAVAMTFESTEGEIAGRFIEQGESPFGDREVLGGFLSVALLDSALRQGFLEAAEAIVLEDPEVNAHLMP